MAYYWIKLYHEILDDPKMATLPDRLWRRVIELFLIAGRTEHEGAIPDARQIAWSLRVPVEEILHDLDQIISIGIIEPIPNGYTVVNFSKRQGPNSDQERKKQQRSRERSQQYNGNVTNVSRNVTQNRTEQNRVEVDEPATPAYIPQDDEQRIYCAVTNHATMPGDITEISQARDKIAKIRRANSFDLNGTVEYLRPYWQACKKRYPSTTGLFWIDWAVTGAIPDGKKQPSKKAIEGV